MLQALVAGGAEGLLLVRDSVACEGRSLLRAFAAAAAQRAERVLVVLFETPREQFEAGLSPAVRQQLQFRDGFSNPLGWTGPDSELRVEEFGEGVLAAGGGPLTVVLDSLSWLLLRLPAPRLCQTLGAMLQGTPKSGPGPPRLVALLHEELHPPGLLQALGAMASTQLVLGGSPQPGPGTPRLVTILSRPRRGGGGTRKDETFTLLSDGSLGAPPPETPQETGGSSPPLGTPRLPAAPPGLGGVTFRLGLSAAERAARAALPPPYQKSILLQRPGTIPCPPEPPEDEDPEDPDDDLDV